MASTNPLKPQDGQAMTPDEREEARLVKALEFLNVLHVGASELRGTIPRMTEPLKTARNSPELYAALMKSVDGAQSEIRNYQNLLEQGGYKQIFERANKSRRENPMGIVPWDATEHSGWYETGLSLKRRT
ncbi:hypothetical protein VUR80DRAFT_8506 [Thermomyces stellatus]